MTPREVAEAVSAAAAARGATARVDGLTVNAAYSGRTAQFNLPVDSADLDSRASIPGALPSRARGDVREKTLYNILQDMVGQPESRIRDSALREALANLLPADPNHRQVLAGVAEKQYWIHPSVASGGTRPFLAPFHSDLPGSFSYQGRYKSFRGSLLLFLCWDGEDFDLALPSEIINFLGSDDGLNPLDRAFLTAARGLAGLETAAAADPERLVQQFGASLRKDFAQGAFDQEGLDRIRRDLRTVVGLELPRHEKAHALIVVFSLHIALYYYRLAYRLGEGLRSAAQVLDGQELPDRPDFHGRIFFRVGSAGDRPVRASDPCARSWWDLDEQHLLALPASMVSANLLHEAAQASGVDCGPIPDPYACAQALAADRVGAVLTDLLCAASAAIVQSGQLDPGADEPGTGGYALRETVLASFRSRSSLKQRGRDIVNTLVGGFGGELKRVRGRVRFFELDEQVIFLLVKLILASSQRHQLAFRKDFLPALRKYGLAPQSATEEELLSQALGRLGLLERYSDAGEALYVRHIL
ncbi:hypothetical protein OG589_27410 [Sphaerisporangium sp. NBC_01403]|uniref:hypothetical protein n=1 Tax=Sphaerisporangium sp. NBC_01403 TaxID=2903599 RepID=UPI0032433964